MPRHAVSPASRLEALFNRPTNFAKAMRACRCRPCRTRRAQPFSCRVCGYSGVPLVYPCDCGAEAGPNVPPCTPTDPSCAHGCRECPVCLNGSAMVDYADRYDNPWLVVRDIRKALVAQGLLS